MCQLSCKSNTYNTYPIGFKMCRILHVVGITRNALLSLVNALVDRGSIIDHTGRTATLIPKFCNLIQGQFWQLIPILQSSVLQQIQFLRYFNFVIVHRNTCWTMQIGTHMSFLTWQKILQNPLVCSRRNADTLVDHHGTTESSVHLRLPFGRGKQWDLLHTRMKVVLHCFFNLVEGKLRLGILSAVLLTFSSTTNVFKSKTKGLKYFDYIKNVRFQLPS